MQIFNYSPDTGEYLGASEARESPLEEGVFLVPANATKLVPPSPADNEIAVFDGDQWGLVADLRGVTLYDTATKHPVKVTGLGVEPNGNTLTEIAPVAFEKWQGGAWVEDLDAKKAHKKREINAAADNALAALTDPYPQAEKLSWDKQEAEARGFLSDPAALVPLVSQIAAARGLDITALCLLIVANADNFVTVSGLVFGKRQALSEQLEAAQTVADVDAITVNYNE